MNARHIEAVSGLGDTEPGELDMLAHPAIAAADADLAMPWWYWLLAATALVGACAMSAALPWGFALAP